MIRIYFKPSCPHCTKAKEYLTSNDIEYEEIDLSKKENREERKFYRSLGIDILPVIVGTNKDGDELIFTGWDMWKAKEIKRTFG